MQAHVREAVMRAFRAKGWRVEFSSHQHDGDSLVFKPLTPTPTGETT
jgi:hypothetical protein